MSNEILFERHGGWGVVTLNRPSKLNALTWGMVEALRAHLMKWEIDPAIGAVLVKGAGDRAFSAGADIRWVHDEAKRDPKRACGFFHEEYRVNAVVHHFPKPYVALIDGIVMGGGVGLSVHGSFRVAGDRTIFAMPETAIGLFPDVGGGYFMPRLHDGLGFYLALSGARAKAADLMAAGIATHYAPTDQAPALEAALLALRPGTRAHADIEAVLDRFAADPGDAPLNLLRPQIKRLFLGRERIEDLVTALEKDGGQFARETLATFAKMSPTSMKLSFEQMKRGHGMDFDHVMQMEFRIVRRVMEGRDFFEGVRATIIDKDKNPQWRPAGLSDVSDAEIAEYFAPLGDEELTLP